MKKTTGIPAQAKKIFTATYGRVVGVSLIGTLGGGAVAFIMGIFLGLGDLALADASLSPIFILIVSASVLATLLILTIPVITTVSISTILINNKSLREAIGFGITRGLRAVPVSLLLFFLIFVSSIPSVTIIVLSLLMSSDVLSLLFITLGASLFLLPFVIVVRSSFIIFIWVEQQKERVWSIFKKSFALTRGSVAWMIVLAITIIGIGVAIMYPLVLAGLSAIGTPLSTETLSSITDGLVNIFLITPAAYALSYPIYQHAKKHNKSVKKKNA